VEVRLLDGFAIREKGQDVDLGGRKPRTLLALLAAHTPTAVSVDRCIQAIWGEDAPPGAKRSLQTYVSSLRAAIDPDRRGRLEGSDDGYRLRLVEGDRRDLDDFRRRASADDPTEFPADVASRLASALDQWGPQPLGDLAYDEWAQPHIRDWTAERLAVVEACTRAHLAAGAPAAGIALLEQTVDDHPLHEQFTGLLMTALYQSGRQTEALARYRNLATTMGDELGLEPSPELRELEERILLHDPSLTTRRPTPTNLPVEAKETIVRDAELETLQRLSSSARLLTITGAGGTGKTTIARALAHHSLDAYPDGVWWFSLAGLSTADVLPSEMLGAMRQTSPVGTPPLDTAISHLRARKTLLVFDNCEHLIEPVTTIIGTILRQCPDTVVLATSREQLAVSGEVAWRLPPLTLPHRDDRDARSVLASEAARLFEMRARLVQEDFRITDDNAMRVASVCRRLDGLPVGIELAAARLGSMGLGELEGRLDDRFAALSAQGDQSHHRTLWEMVEWSYDLLPDDHQEVYRKLSLFRGGFDLAGAEAVTEVTDVVTALDSLVVRSLVVADHRKVTPRYFMLETIREHGMQVLQQRGEMDQARQLHLRWAADLAREGSRHLEGPDAQAWMGRFRAETDNFRAALEHSIEVDPVTGAVMTAILARFWWGHATDGDPATLDDATSFLEEGHGWALRMLAAAGDDLPPKIRARLLTSLGGMLEVRTGRFREALEHLDEAIQTLDGLDEPRLVAWAGFYRGIASWGMTPISETFEAFDRACRLGEAAGDPVARISAQMMRGWVHATEARFDEAKADMDQVMTFAEKVGNPSLLAHAEDSLACLAIMAGSPTTQAQEQISRVIQRFRRIPNYACMAHGLHTAAAWLARTDRLEQAARAIGIAQGVRDRLNMIVPPYEDRTPIVEAAGLNRLAEDVREVLFAEGRSTTPDEGIDWILATISE
jgi:predicted ATPase/DNA-binding SARP family transcriptional activator